MNTAKATACRPNKAIENPLLRNTSSSTNRQLTVHLKKKLPRQLKRAAEIPPQIVSQERHGNEDLHQAHHHRKLQAGREPCPKQQDNPHGGQDQQQRHLDAQSQRIHQRTPHPRPALQKVDSQPQKQGREAVVEAAQHKHAVQPFREYQQRENVRRNLKTRTALQVSLPLSLSPKNSQPHCTPSDATHLRPPIARHDHAQRRQVHARKQLLCQQDVGALAREPVQPRVDVDVRRRVDQRARAAADARVVALARDDLGYLFHMIRVQRTASARKRRGGMRVERIWRPLRMSRVKRVMRRCIGGWLCSAMAVVNVLATMLVMVLRTRWPLDWSLELWMTWELG
ncbi:hypothetical protein CHGG_04136 [Chaetomium globosum CBS 148.51]|uniref:Uncharacterized protein n=1 Tax=Chaetomium globosum (strain ATCC 6205 / CBS 148.51 / DSM 1962 / NBRC 6347 / NRRL 1970) TaxID=306901 RepID=Q2H260_CHAGB|nr:uncharacterized protein CHGG_04136 [Chaetomium globosum CBS 148.51]EAQ87517.1 hypothetical protein CHGG_04136 [Chaetomium globosum CBS 148.51]